MAILSSSEKSTPGLGAVAQRRVEKVDAGERRLASLARRGFGYWSGGCGAHRLTRNR
jgi:hypothetical protein